MGGAALLPALSTPQRRLGSERRERRMITAATAMVATKTRLTTAAVA